MDTQVAGRPQTGSTVLHAMEILSNLVERQCGGDSQYFEHQRARYVHNLGRIEKIQPAPCKVLDIGSHYLHQPILLRQMGYEVWGMDIELFTGAQFVKERSRMFDIPNIAVNTFENGEFLVGQENRFDLILFTEILEHITFNPVRFWHRVFDLLSPNGAVYLSTPNSLRPAAQAKALWKLLTFGGIGLNVEQILQTVTYGHHWKEYSASEIRQYFRLLSSDFLVETTWYSSDLATEGFKTMVKRLLATIPCFRSDIEAVVRLSGKTGFSARSPRLPMHTHGSKDND
jgi:2-polyprenyl-3-methyl-5-hydroxy-6-metoxy-1,4-benzoquinol methylase